ncbi:MAG: VWA domain-containing protein, partial [Bacteroidales bacterium]|nr:VWA domain-containing protein [Bacteroidales bacterium]
VHIGNNAFYEDKNVRIFELFSCLETISKNAFDKTVKNLVVKFFSFTPINIERDAFQGLSENSTLMVPKGTKLIFEKALPWSVFDNVEEMDLESNLVDSQEEVLSVDEYKFRLESVANSIYKVDREYLRNIIQDLSYDYLNVSTDEEYNEALSLIAYNNRFNPPILPNLEVVICKSWESKYRLRILGKSILEYGNVPALDNFIANGKVYNDISSIPFLNTETICLESNLLPLRSNIVVESYFENILSKIQNELLDAEHDVKIAVSWFTNYDLFKTVNELADKDINIEIVINNDLINNGGYCLNFDELISKESVRFYLVEYPHLLHHKFCIIDDKTIINGSYNWTRFSGSNYENIMIIRNDVNAVSAFNDEFERILHQAEYKNIDKMPNYVPERPEYDRSAFKQYITEELDSAAHEISNERDKITILHKASCLNPEYFEKINPKAKIDFADAFRVLEDQSTATNDVIEMINSSIEVLGNEEQNKKDETKEKECENLVVDNQKSGTKDVIQGNTYFSENLSVNSQLKEKIESIKASSLFLVLDVSGSMKSLYTAGHIHNIAEKVLSVSLTISESKEVSLWKFGNRAEFVEYIGLDNIQSVKKVHCEGTGTALNAFVNAASGLINDGSLVIIFTDDDLGSIKKAVWNIKNKSKVFWQIIVYGKHKNISSEISNCSNVSLICMDDYASKSNKEINQILLNDYISWKNK